MATSPGVKKWLWCLACMAPALVIVSAPAGASDVWLGAAVLAEGGGEVSAGNTVVVDDIATVGDSATMVISDVATDAAPWVVKMSGKAAQNTGLAAGDVLQLTVLLAESGGQILGYALTIGGRVVLYITDLRQPLPLYSRQIDG